MTSKCHTTHTITSTVPCPAPPAWAFLQRKLIEALSASVYRFLNKYTRDDGSLIWRETWNNGRDGVDDFYEAFYNWPLLFLLGGDDALLELSQRQWDAVTRQLTALGPVHEEYERGYDQFHQSEHYTYFCFLCLADPNNTRNIERAKRFADFYVDPATGNYDPVDKLIRAPHNGSGGPRWGFFDGQNTAWSWSPWMTPYGLPFHDVPGVRQLDDLKDIALARLMGAALHERYGKGDVAANLGVTSLITNAYLLTGEAKYRNWITEYVGAWLERAQRNGGLIPDNVGLSGRVGEYLDGKWYGGLYGWQWPHGYYSLGMATTVAATCAYLVTRDERYLELSRAAMDKVWSLGKYVSVREVKQTSLAHHWHSQLAQLSDDDEIWVVPYRHGDDGWFDYQPMSPAYSAALWNVTRSAEDWDRIKRIWQAETYDWCVVTPFRNKEDAGHEQPWLRFIAGDNPGYPEAILSASYAQMSRRLALIRQDSSDLTKVHIHHWQQLNPVTTEALVQLTLGAPQHIYNGGLLIAPLRYYDAERKRPGLSEDVAALVEKIESSRLVVRLVNLSPFEQREVMLQSGTFGEHRFDAVRYAERTSDYPGEQTRYAAPQIEVEQRDQLVGNKYMNVVLPPASEITLELTMSRYVNPLSYALPG